MEDDSESSCDERIEDLTKTKKFEFPQNSTKSLDSTNLEPYTISIKPLQKFASGVPYEINKSLSSQVMEYYHKYSQSSNLNRFFSLPNANAERHGYSWKARDQIIPRSRQTVASSNENKTVSVFDAPKERRKWTRPPLVGQLSGSSGKVIPSSYIERISSEPRTSIETPVKTDTFLETEGTENSQRLDKSVNSNFETIDRDLKILSPTSSNTSHKPLEWDSWADVGYNNVLSLTEKESVNMLRTVEQKVSTQSLCSTSFRLDPEGTTASNVESFNDKTNNSLLKTRQHSSEPDAHSTRLTDGILDSDEIKITPIIKTSHSNIIVGDVTGNEDISLKSDVPTKKDEENPASNVEEIDKSKISDAGKSNPSQKNILVDDIITPIIDSCKRSISELDLRKIISNDYKELSVPFKFQSNSSFAVINKPILCDKSIQINSTLEYGYKQKSKESNISSTADLDESKKVNAEEKVKNWQTELPDEIINKLTNERFRKKEEMNPTLKSPQSISEYEVKAEATNYSKTKGEFQGNENFHSENQEKTEGGRTSNSFEYFPGHTFRNFPHGDNASRTSSFESERSCSTMPNTSSSLDEKLWGHSDSLLHDLERSLTILKSLVNANKCDKQVKKRLIHHVIKRLITAKYTDDKIEYKLEDNVPWNPDNARNKIYCTEMIQAFAKKRNQQNSTEESSEDSKLNKRVFSSNCKNQSGNREIKGKNQFVNSESSDNFEERNTDRTDYMLDGRKARMGLRNDKRRFHYYRHNQSNHQKDSEVFDIDKYESSDSFLPQLKNLNYKEKPMVKSVNGVREISSAPITATTSARIIQNSTSTATTTITTTPNASISSTVITTATTTNAITTTNTTTPISINSSLENLKKQSEIERNIGREKIDWRLPSTMSERRFADEWCTSRIASATRLIDYVEVEKKNQLMWINSEINHLSSLKKLLEESVKSIKKNENDYSREELLLNIEEKSKRLGENLPKSEYFKNKPWSSHGNLVEKCNENYKLSERQNGHEKQHLNDATKNELSDSVQTARSQLARVSSSPEVCQHEEVKSDEYKCNRRPLTSDSKQLMNDQTSRDRSKIRSKKETKNRLNDQCKSDFEGNEKEEKIDKTKCCHKCCHKNRESNSEDDRGQSQEEREIKEKGKKSVTANQMILCEDCKAFRDKINPNLSSNSIYIKPIAYELSFEKKNEKKGSNVNQSYEKTSNSPISQMSDSGDNSHCDSIQFHLKDYLKKNKPKFVDNVEMRKRYISEISQLRLLKKKNRMQLLVNDQVSNLAVNQKPKLSTKSLKKLVMTK